MIETIGFVGLGRMGAQMAGRLLAAGHRVTVFDIDPAAVEALAEKGAEPASSVRAVADASEAVLVSLPTPAIVQQIAIGPGGIVESSKVRVFVDLSTSGPAAATALHRAFADRAIASLDAPVSGGVKGAREGTLAVMVSGPSSAYQELEPVLKVLGKLFFMGETPGGGQTMKLANNLLSIGAIALTSEAMTMGMKAGLDPKQMIDVLNVSSGRSSATMDKWPRSILPRSFDFGFANGLAFKDVGLCINEAEAMGVPMVVGSAVRQMLLIANQVNGPQSDFTEIAKVVEQWAGLQPDPAD